MDIFRLGVAALLVLAAAVGAEAKDTSIPITVTVRVYRNSAPPRRFDAARSYADRLFRAAGIGVSWLQCGADLHAVIPAPPECQRPLDPTDLILHVVPATDSNADSHQESLGFALIDAQTGDGRVATVYVDRVAAMARDAAVEGADVLGRAIAHEIGHLLMRTSQHATSGLMRATWTRTELQRNRPPDWSFAKGDAQQMRSIFVRP